MKHTNFLDPSLLQKHDFKFFDVIIFVVNVIIFVVNNMSILLSSLERVSILLT